MAGGSWTLNSTPANEVLNGISYPNESYAFAVGNNGAIVQFISGDNGTLMDSGTTNDMYDVFATDGNTAIAAGEDVVLVWDGINWTPIVENTNGTIYTGTWITPEEDAMFYESLGSPFNFVCPYVPGATQQPFCRAYQNPVMAFCGSSNDIKMITADGDIHWINNLLNDLADDFMPIHDEPVPLGLTAVWAPQWNCLLGGIEPLELFAIRNNNDFYRFDGSDWVDMNVNVPSDHVLTWIGGYNVSQMKAVGFKPDGKGGNEGVLWEYDGSSWTDQSASLPNGTPGLTDIAFNSGLPNLIFSDGFESLTAQKNQMATGVDILAAAEAGSYLRINELFDVNPIDISVKIDLLTAEPIRIGDEVTFGLRILNLTPEDAANVGITNGYQDIYLKYVNDDCEFTGNRAESFWTYYLKNIPLLAAGEIITCEITYEVKDSTASEFIVTLNAYSSGASEINYRNNRDHKEKLIYPQLSQ